MKNTIKNRLNYLWILPILVLTLSSIPKIFAMDFMVQGMEAAGMGIPVVLLGIIELLCIIIFLIPQTRTVGFLLVTAYIGGIIAVEWGTSPHNPAMGMILQILLWTGMYFENPSLFRIFSQRKKITT